jgi:hypothetical protein
MRRAADDADALLHEAAEIQRHHAARDDEIERIPSLVKARNA